jgi:hypothetical protein
MTDKPLSNLALQICQELLNLSGLTEGVIATLTMDDETTRIDVYTCLNSLESCGIIQSHLDEEEEWVYSLSPVWKERLTKSCSCGGCHHD